ncbi:hypothetical protein [Stigmatella hybrida]|uniref:hypothetical protein n=1 Tax=Stigmatella hybrida TaxID=394097 RepID=UPI001CDAC391|nr:hypothetical protein [Stigmatella hybrida]
MIELLGWGFTSGLETALTARAIKLPIWHSTSKILTEKEGFEEKAFVRDFGSAVGLALT